MLKAKALAHFDDNHTKLAHELGITRSAVSQWGEVVPLASALQLERLTSGKLKTDWSLYDRRAPGSPKAAA